MASRTMYIAAILLTTSPLAVLSLSWTGIDAATANLQSQLETGQLRQAYPHQALQEQDVADYSKQLEVASGRLLAEQRLSIMQLQQAGVTSRNLFLQPRPDLGQPSQISLLQQRPELAQPSQISYRPMALPQTKTEETREGTQQKNPALAAVLLEPVLHWYTICAWGFFMVLSGISSVCLTSCVIKQRAANQALPEVVRQPTAEPTQNQGLSQFRSYLPNPKNLFGRFSKGENAQVPAPQSRMQQDSEAVETWIKVPRGNESVIAQASLGYLDDSEDEC